MSFVGVAGIYACIVADDHVMIEARIEKRGTIVGRAGVVDQDFFVYGLLNALVEAGEGWFRDAGRCIPKRPDLQPTPSWRELSSGHVP